MPRHAITRRQFDWRPDFTASIVVFLVALPLCVGVAVASGVPAELGLVTGIVGGLVVGMLPGSSLQVSGPAAGLTVLVYEAIREFGPAGLGVIVLATGLLQILLGVLRFGRWFRAISPAVVEGMLAGIGLVLIAGQLYTMVGVPAPGGGIAKLAGLPQLAGTIAGSSVAWTAFAIGAGTIAVMVLWPKLPKKLTILPGALVAVVLATVVSVMAGLPAQRIEVRGLFGSVDLTTPADLVSLGNVAVLGTIVAFTLIASAESLFSAAAVDRMHTGPRTDYNDELVAQGVGNSLCGLIGALPMTAVIVRSSANVNAGARTKASRVLHGVWLLLFTALLPSAIGVIPLAALAGVLVHAGFKLLPLRRLVHLWKRHRGEAVILVVTAVAIIGLNMFEGVLIGLTLAVIKVAWQASHVNVKVRDIGTGPIHVSLWGTATFLRLPVILETLEALPTGRSVDLDLTSVRHLAHAVRSALTAWADRHKDTAVSGAIPDVRVIGVH